MKNLILLILLIFIASGVYYASQKVSPSLNSPVIEQAQSTKITREQAADKVKNLPEVQDYLKRVPNGIVEVDNELDGQYNVHVYEIKDGHTATFNWYRVNIKSGEIKSEF